MKQFYPLTLLGPRFSKDSQIAKSLGKHCGPCVDAGDLFVRRVLPEPRDEAKKTLRTYAQIRF